MYNMYIYIYTQALAVTAERKRREEVRTPGNNSVSTNKPQRVSMDVKYSDA